MGSAGIPMMDEPVFCTYADLDRLIDTCELSTAQRNVVDALMYGYTLTDIAEMQECAKQTVDVHYRRAVEKIVRQNKSAWDRVYKQSTHDV